MAHTHTHNVLVQYNTHRAADDLLSNMSKTIRRQIFVVTGDTNQMLICKHHRGLNLWTTARLTGRLVERNPRRNYSKKQTNENKTGWKASGGKQTTSARGRNVLNIGWDACGWVGGWVWGEVWVKSASERFHAQFMVEIPQCTEFDPPSNTHICRVPQMHATFISCSRNPTVKQLVADVQDSKMFRLCRIFLVAQ